MGNELTCTQCTPMQVEDVECEEKRMHFQMTKMREFSHYSRDFQVEQKFNHICMKKPNYQITVKFIYPSRLKNYKDLLIKNVGSVEDASSSSTYRFQENKTHNDINPLDDCSQQEEFRIFKMGTINLKCQVKSQEFSLLYQECLDEEVKLKAKLQEIDAFVFLVDGEIDFLVCDYVVQFVSQSCKLEAVVFLASPKTVTTISFLEDKSEVKEIEESLLEGSLKKADTKKSVLNQALKKERTVLQKWVKSIIDIYWNTDFLLFDFESRNSICEQLEVVFSQVIYSQDSSTKQVK